MNTFAGFSEAGQLYSENLPLIEEMRQAYESDVAACIASITEGLERVLGQKVETQQGKDFYWWLEGHDEGPSFWTKLGDRSYMNAERLIVFCGINNDSKPIIAGLSALAAGLGARAYRTPTKWKLFSLDLPLDTKEGVEQTVAALANAIRVAHDEYLRISAAERG